MDKKISINTSLFFYLAYFLILCSYYFSNVIFLQPHLEKFRILSSIIFLFVCFIQSKSYPKNVLLKIIIITLLTMGVSIHIKEWTILNLILIIFASYKINVDELIKKDVFFKIIILVLVILFYKMGLTYVQDFYRDNITRYSLGFWHPNALGGIVSCIYVEFLYIFREKKNYILLILLFLISIIVNFYCDSRSSMVIIILVSLLYIINNNKKIKFFDLKVVKFITKNIWIIMTIISIGIGLLYKYNTSIGIAIDQIITSRPRWIARFMDNYPVRLFGNKMVFVNEIQAVKYNLKIAILDNAYVRFLLQYGLILSFLMHKIIKKIVMFAYKNKNSMLIGILMILLIRGFSEHGCYSLYNNIFLIYYSNILFLKESDHDE